MNIIRNILALILGIGIGGAINMAIILAGPSVIPPPEGVDVTNMESIRASMHLFEAKHYITPFLAHGIGTLAGAFVAFVVAASHRSVMSYLIGGVFLAGGIAASLMIPAPAWFIVIDLLIAYIPMAWLGRGFGQKITA